MKKKPGDGFARVWARPVLLGLLTASGLVSGLVSEGWGDAWSWLALGIPIAAAASGARTRRRT